MSASPPTSARSPVAERSTRERILDAAEVLFARRGSAGASLRAITARARVNLAAVHYHFGSKERLLQEVIERRIAPVNRQRLERLRIARRLAAPGPPSIEAVLDAFLAPACALAPRVEFGPVFTILTTEPLESAGPPVRSTFGEVNAAFNAALREALPALDAAEVEVRFQLVVGSMLHMLSRRGAFLLASAPDAAALLDLMVRFAAAGLRAPAAGATP